MAGITFDTNGGAPRRARFIALALAGLIALAAVAMVATVEPPSAHAAKTKKKKKKGAGARTSARASACSGNPDTLYPYGVAPPSNFTMILRVNTLNDVKTFTQTDESKGGLQPRIQDRDIFLINTRFAAGDADTEQQIATQLRAAFPCNRIFSLNGVSLNPNASSYLFSLVNAPEVSAYLVDWEKADWDIARANEPGLPAWVDTFTPMLARLTSRLGALRGALSGSGKPFGVVPFFRTDWDFGQIERTVQRQNSLVAANRQGFQSVQTQKSCQTGGPAGLAGQIKTLFTQYKKANFRKIKKKKGSKSKPRRKFKRVKPKLSRGFLGAQISFTATPDPSAPDPVKSVPVSTAAACTIAAVNGTQGAILYWARPSDVKALLADPNVCALRPSPTGVC
jgi:hypothetical protein